MSSVSLSRRALALGVALGAALTGACADSRQVVTPSVADPLFASYVALGNSITAGLQSAGINDSTQQQSYAYLMATQAMQTRFAYPALAKPGCPPPIENFQTQQRVGGASSTSTTCFLRVPTSVTTALNNVAVPNAYSIDPISTSTPNSNPLTTFILGGHTQAQTALAVDPTFASVWIGNNDVLAAAASGLLVPTPNVSPGVTPVATYTTNMDSTLAVLTTAPHLKGGVLIGVVQVVQTPILFPAAALFNPAFKAGFDQFAGATTTILPSCTPTTTALISFQIVSAIRSGQHPPVIGCAPGSVPGTPVGDIFVLDPTEQATLTATVTQYNAYLQQKAQTLGWAYFDPNPALAQLRASGAIPAVPNLASATAPFGTYISLDGVHPARPAHVVLANGIIDAINAKYGTSLGHVQ